jgi:hypothetical protein
LLNKKFGQTTPSVFLNGAQRACQQRQVIGFQKVAISGDFSSRWVVSKPNEETYSLDGG